MISATEASRIVQVVRESQPVQEMVDELLTKAERAVKANSNLGKTETSICIDDFNEKTVLAASSILAQLRYRTQVSGIVLRISWESP